MWERAQTPQVTFPSDTLPLWVPAAPKFQLPSGSDTAVASLLGHPSTQLCLGSFSWDAGHGKTPAQGHKCIPGCSPGTIPSPPFPLWDGAGDKSQGPERGFEAGKSGNVFIAGLIIYQDKLESRALRIQEIPTELSLPTLHPARSCFWGLPTSFLQLPGFQFPSSRGKTHRFFLEMPQGVSTCVSQPREELAAAAPEE